MGGGLMQLVAYGAQDVYLTGNPQITFFKVVYRRHTNFSMEAIQQTIDGTVGTGASTVTSTISRNGDLVGRMWLDVRLTAAAAPNNTNGAAVYLDYCLNTGHAFVNQVEVEIGGQRIDRHDGHYLDAYNELTDHLQEEAIGLNKGQPARNTAGGVNASLSATPLQLYIPLKFWFNKNPGLALPLIALQYHEVKVKLTTRATLSLLNSDTALNNGAALTAPTPTVNLWADYIYLDTDERRRFAQVSHEYLIEQVQTETFAMATSVTLNLNHPVKELIWGVQDNRVFASTTTATANRRTSRTINAAAGTANCNAPNDYFNYLTTSTASPEVVGSQVSAEPFGTAKLVLNGQDRFAARNATYFRTCQPCQAGHRVSQKHLYCYSFALKPEEHQPSGTCNFSRIDNAQLQFTNPAGVTPANASTLRVWAINYNVLRIMSGMGGLAYSN